MSDNETIVEIPDDLDAFSDLLYGREAPEVEAEVEAEVDQETDEAEVEAEAETEVDEPEAEADDEEADPSEDESKDESDEEDEKPRRNRKTAKERIQELNYEKKLAEQRYADAIARLKQLEEKQPEDDSKTAHKADVDPGAPSPEDKDDKGELLYPLGEFDPAYIRALARFTINEETKAAKAQAVAEAEQARVKAAREAQTSQWQVKLEAAQEEFPDLVEKVSSLTDMFDGIQPEYGQYLVDVVQLQLESGPAVLRYLADHPKEAKNIVNSGAAAATVALGRLDARLTVEKQRADKAAKVSNAPAPPKQTPRGTGRVIAVAGDTDDLDAFEKAFFNKKK